MPAPSPLLFRGSDQCGYAACAVDGIRIDLAPLDLLRAISGIATIRPEKAWKQQATTLVDLLLKGAGSTR